MVNTVMDFITSYDKEVGEAIQAECGRQRRNLELIASENIVSEPVMMAMGTVLTNKYAEGYPGKRYYGGCQYVDVLETIAIERAKKLFGCDYANVQPHSGAQANMAVFIAMLKPGDTVMGMNLDHGGHLTHGSPVNFSGLYFNIVPYGVDDEGFIDYDELERKAKEAKPKLIVAGASAYARTIDFKRFREIADEVGAYLMVDMAHIAGLVAAGEHPSPIPYADVVTTTTHKTLRGPRGGLILANKEAAENAENLLDGAFAEYDHLHHDVGFMWHISAGVNYRLTGNKKSRLRALYAADFLAARYNPAGKYVRSWNADSDTDGYNKLIIDSMMNIPMLYWAAKEHNDDRFKQMAINHANTVMKTHIRPDGTSHHIVEVDPKDGSIVKSLGGQGYENGSTWTRGQAWAIYGFTLSYIHTGDEKYLMTAKKVANAFIACAAQSDWIVPLDFRQPPEPVIYDATAAACAACGLLEISKTCSEYDKKNYLNAALKLLKALDEKAADYTTDKDNLLDYCSEAYYPGRGEAGLNTAIIYGDYYYTEAIYKLKGFKELFW